MQRLAIFPENGLEQSLHAPVLVGLVVTAFFAETLGWGFGGLVVPGYLAAVLCIAPVTGATVVVEAILTFLVVRALGEWLSKSGAWAAFFGRERFFLFVVTSVLVRIVMDGAVLPMLAERFEFRQSLELYSIGLVLVPLLANATWNSGLPSGLFHLGVTTGVTYAVLKYGLLQWTNLSMSHFELTYESITVNFLDLPKPYVVLLVGSLLAARDNVLYGWDYNGILVPGLLAVAWYHPTRLASTLVEAVTIYIISRFVVGVPPLSRVLVEGPRRMVLAFAVGFGLKMVMGFIAMRFWPSMRMESVTGFGYMLASLLAVKIWQLEKVARVLLPTLQVSLVAFVVGNALGFGMQVLPAALASAATPEAQAPATEARRESAAFELVLADATLPSLRRSPAQPGFAGFDARLEALARAIHDVRTTGHASARSQSECAAHGIALRSAPRKPEGRWLLFRPEPGDPDDPTDAARAAISDQPGAPWVVAAMPSSPGSPIVAVALRVAEELGARAAVILGKEPAERARDSAILRTIVDATHAEHVLRVEESTTAEGASIAIVGRLPEGLDAGSLEKTLGMALPIRWDAVPVDEHGLGDVEAGSRMILSTSEAARAGARVLEAPEVESWGHDAGTELAQRLTALTTVGPAGYRPPDVDQLRVFGRVVMPAMLSSASAVSGARPPGRTPSPSEDRAPDPWARAVAGKLGYRVAKAAKGVLVLYEPEGTERRGHATLVLKGTANEEPRPTLALPQEGTGDDRRGVVPVPVVVEVPAPRFEMGTAEAAIAVARATRASAWIVAGVLPYAGVGSAESGARIDPSRSYFQRMHELMLAEGARVLSIRGMPADRAAPEGQRERGAPTHVDVEDVVVSTGDESPRSDMRPQWTGAIEALLARRGWRVGWFDGTLAHMRLEGAGDPALLYAQRFHPDSMLLLWFSPLVRDGFVRASADQLSARIERSEGHLTEGDAVARAVALSAAKQAQPRCALDGSAEAFRRYVTTRNPYELHDALSGRGGCSVELILDTDASAPYAIVATRGQAILVALAGGRTPAAREVFQVPALARAALSLGAAEVRLKVP